MRCGCGEGLWWVAAGARGGGRRGSVGWRGGWVWLRGIEDCRDGSSQAPTLREAMRCEAEWNDRRDGAAGTESERLQHTPAAMDAGVRRCVFAVRRPVWCGFFRDRAWAVRRDTVRGSLASESGRAAHALQDVTLYFKHKYILCSQRGSDHAFATRIHVD